MTIMNKILFGLLLLVGFTNCSKDDEPDYGDAFKKWYFFSELTNEPYVIFNQKDNSTIIQKLDDKGNVINSYSFSDYPPTKTTISPGYGQDAVETDVIPSKPDIVELQDVFVVNRTFSGSIPSSSADKSYHKEYNFIDILTKDLQQNIRTIEDSEYHLIGYWNKTSFAYAYPNLRESKIINSRGDIIKEKVNLDAVTRYYYPLKTAPFIRDGEWYYCSHTSFFEANEADEFFVIQNHGNTETKEVNGKKEFYVGDLLVYWPGGGVSLKSYFKLPSTLNAPVFNLVSGKIEGNIFTVVLNVINQDGNISKHQLEINTDTNDVCDSLSINN